MVNTIKPFQNSNPIGVVYTCITGNYDSIINFHYIDKNWHYICFTDCPPKNPQNYIWKFLPLSFNELDNVRNHRWHKLHPNLLFPEYEISLYIDANLDLLTCDVFNDVKNQINQKQIIAIAPHFRNNNIYDEFNACLQCGKDSADIIKKQENLFRKLGFSGDYMNGRFFETNIMYRQHHNNIIVRIMNDWWWFIKHYSCRDQLSLTYVLWKHNINVPLLTDRTYREGNIVKYDYEENHITLSEAKVMIARLSHDLAERNAQIVSLNHNLPTFSNDIVTMMRVIEDKDKIINSLLSSRSWRITWPLRKLDNALRNLHQWLSLLWREFRLNSWNTRVLHFKRDFTKH